MDKKTILAFVLIGIIIILWPVYEEKVLGIKRTARPSTTQKVQQTIDKKETKQIQTSVDNVLPPERPIQIIKTEDVDTLVLETALFRGLVSSKGGGTIIGWQMKKYLNAYGKPVELIPDSAQGNLDLTIGNPSGNQIDLSGIVFQILSNTSWTENKKVYHKLVFGCNLDGIGSIEKELMAVEGSYNIQIKIRFIPIESTKSVTRYSIYWKSGLAPTEKNIRDENGYYEALALQGDEILKSKSDATGLREGVTTWTAVRNKYFLIAIIPVGSMGSATALKGEKTQIKDSKGNLAPWKHLTTELAIPFQKFHEDTSRIILYIGPMDYHLLKFYGVKLEKNMNFGWVLIRPFSIAFLYTLEFLYKIVGNYGWAIVIFSILIKVLLQPLMKKSMQSMKQMQELQPKMNALREKYKNDAQRLNAETMKLYKAHGINPMGGCLPMILQMPILFALFNLFRTTIMLRQANFLGVIKDLSVPDHMIVMGQSAINALPILMGVSMIVQQRLTMQDPKQKFTTYFMSIFMIYVFYNLAAGLNLYYFIFNVLTIAQELYIKSKRPEAVLRMRYYSLWFRKLFSDVYYRFLLVNWYFVYSVLGSHERLSDNVWANKVRPIYVDVEKNIRDSLNQMEEIYNRYIVHSDVLEMNKIDRFNALIKEAIQNLRKLKNITNPETMDVLLTHKKMVKGIQNFISTAKAAEIIFSKIQMTPVKEKSNSRQQASKEISISENKKAKISVKMTLRMDDLKSKIFKLLDQEIKPAIEKVIELSK